MTLEEKLPIVNWPTDEEAEICNGRYYVLQLELNGTPYIRFMHTSHANEHIPGHHFAMLLKFLDETETGPLKYNEKHRVPQSNGKYKILGIGRAEVNAKRRKVFFYSAHDSDFYRHGKDESGERESWTYLNREHLRKIEHLMPDWKLRLMTI